MNDPAFDAAEHARFALDDAAYVLGALEPADRASFEEHLAGCPLCQAQVAELTDLPALLSRAAPEAWQDEEPPPVLPDTLLPRLLRQVRRERSRQRWQVALTSAVAACVITVLTALGVVLVSRSQEPKPIAFTAMAGVTSPVQATAVLTSAGNGTTLRVRCGHYTAPAGYVPGQAGGAPAGDYRLVVINKSGARLDRGGWPVGPDIDLTTSTPWPKEAISQILITNSTGTPVLQVTL